MIPKYRDIVDLLKKGATVEAQEKIMELREVALELQEDNMELKETVAKLEREIAKKNKLKYEKPFYWVDDGDNKDGPFCQLCYDDETKTVRLQGGSNDHWHCKRCKNHFYGPNYVKPPKRQRASSVWLNY